MLRTNQDKLVMMSVLGEISSPLSRSSPYRITADGQPVVLPGTGGITYNVRVGDLATGWQADHVEPGVSIKNREKSERIPQGANAALNVLACAGNEARVVSGDGKGEKGIVTGKHGGIEHVLVDFPPKVLDRLAIGDKIMIKALGVGLKLLRFPELKVMNLDPNLLKRMPLREEKKRLRVAVTHRIPAAIMGSGLGANHVYRGDYDIQLFDDKTVAEFGLEDLRFGDVVAIMDADHSYGRIYKKGAISIGIVVHSNCVTAGHGPGVMTILTSSEGKIIPRIDGQANIANYLEIE